MDKERARHWRLKAEECRTVAEQMKNPMPQASFRRMAETYEYLAEQAEKIDEGKINAKDETG